MNPNDSLIEIAPADALDKYLLHRQNEVSEKTLRSHEYRLQHFVRWCSENNIEVLCDLSPRDLQDYL